MEYRELMEELALTNKAVAIRRIHAPEGLERIPEACVLAAFLRAMKGERVVAASYNMRCSGAVTGFGLRDGIPNIPGGIGCFLSMGRGEGFPSGERIKKTPELGENMLLHQPQGVLEDRNALEFCAYEDAEAPDLVSILANPDQLSALIHIFNFESTAYDNVIVPMVSGCASVVRVPLGELRRKEGARAVVGNVDVFSRPHFPADTFFFTVPGYAFKKMVENAKESVLASPIWRGVRKRLRGE